MTVHVTPSGTTWTAQGEVVGEHGEARWMVADEAATARRVPTLLFVHGARHAADHFETTALWAVFRQRLMDEGWAVIEGQGGNDETAATNWGRPAAQLAYRAYLEHVATRLDVGPMVVMGRSMGGIGASNLFVHDPVVSSMASGLMLHQAAASLRALADVPEGGTDGLGHGKFWPALWQRWGAVDRASFLEASAQADPLGWEPDVWRGRAVWTGVATGDTAIPAESHGLALRRRWAGQPRIDRVFTRLGGDHTHQGVFGAVDPMMSFLYAAARTAPPSEDRYRVVSRSRWSDDDGLQLVVDRSQWAGQTGDLER